MRYDKDIQWKTFTLCPPFDVGAGQESFMQTTADGKWLFATSGDRAAIYRRDPESGDFIKVTEAT